jgi:hypothetical protein
MLNGLNKSRRLIYPSVGHPPRVRARPSDVCRRNSAVGIINKRISVSDTPKPDIQRIFHRGGSTWRVRPTAVAACCRSLRSWSSAGHRDFESSRCQQTMSRQGCRGAEPTRHRLRRNRRIQINISMFKSPPREVRYEPVMKMRLLA